MNIILHRLRARDRMGLPKAQSRSSGGPPARLPAGRGAAGFTLAEVVVSTAIIALTVGGLISGYLVTAQRAEWSAYSLAAQSLAAQGIELIRAGKWDPGAWPIIDEIAPTNFTAVEQLDIPITGVPILATNRVAITQVSATPPLRQVRVDCVWMYINRGPFTNTVVTYRAPDR